MSSASIVGALTDPRSRISRIIVCHDRISEFRWLGVLEAALFVCIVPIVLVVGLLRSGDYVHMDDGNTRSRFRRYRHLLTITLLGIDGRVVFESKYRPTSRVEGDALIASVLMAAGDGVVVTEALGAETSAVWYGGRPLFIGPEPIDLEQAVRVLERHGLTVERASGSVTLRKRGEASSRFMGWLVIATLCIAFPLLVLEGARKTFRRARWDTLGVPPEEWTLTVGSSSLECRETRAGVVLHEYVLETGRLLAITFAPTYGYDRDCERRAPHLRLLTRSSAVELAFPIPSGHGAAFRDVLVGAVLASRTDVRS